MIMNGFDIRTLTVAYFSSGAADCFVGGGVLVYTGVTFENVYPLQVSLRARVASGGQVFPATP